MDKDNAKPKGQEELYVGVPLAMLVRLEALLGEAIKSKRHKNDGLFTFMTGKDRWSKIEAAHEILARAAKTGNEARAEYEAKAALAAMAPVLDPVMKFEAISDLIASQCECPSCTERRARRAQS